MGLFAGPAVPEQLAYHNAHARVQNFPTVLCWNWKQHNHCTVLFSQNWPWPLSCLVSSEGVWCGPGHTGTLELILLLDL